MVDYVLISLYACLAESQFVCDDYFKRLRNRRFFLVYFTYMRTSLHEQSIIIVIVFLAAIPTLSHAEIAFRCAAGGMSHPATQQEVNAVGEGIIAGVTQVCGSDATLGISNAAGVAKEYLNNLPNKCVGACQALPDKAHIDKLDNTFAICAADFFKAYQAKYGPVSMSSTFRCGPKTPTVIQCDRTENGRAGGAGGSNHIL